MVEWREVFLSSSLDRVRNNLTTKGWNLYEHQNKVRRGQKLYA
jgi:hypothetical protein